MEIATPFTDLDPFVYEQLTEAERRRIDEILAAPTRYTLHDFARKVNRRYQWYRHCYLLAETLEKVASGEIKRLMVWMPPRHGKSELISRIFPAYYLHRHPDQWVGLTSYAADLARTLSRSARDNFREVSDLWDSSISSVAHWETTVGGGMWSAGVGGPITGKGFHVGIIDDPLKNAKEAASETVRSAHKDWWESTFYTRQEPDAAIIVVQTRWHEDDLSGHLIRQEMAEDERPEGWTILDLPAFPEPEPREDLPDTVTVICDWRPRPESSDAEDAEPLCPERYDAEALLKRKARLTRYFWNALFQNRPKAREGNLFKRDCFRFLPARPTGEDWVWVRYWDKAATADDGDWTAGVLMGKKKGKEATQIIVGDVRRGQWSSGLREEIVTATIESDGDTVIQVMEQEGGSSGKDAVRDMITRNPGFPIRADHPSGDKVLRADPLAVWAELHGIFLVEAEWNEAYIAELTAFPHGKNDDQVDASSGAFKHVSRPRVSVVWGKRGR